VSRTEAMKSPAVGLDVGTSRIVAAWQSDNETRYETQLNAFVTIPYSKMTENVLRKEGVPHAVEAGEIRVHGAQSERFADLLNKEVRRTMTRGILNAGEPDSARLVREISELVLGRAEKGQKLCFTIPAAPLGAEVDLTYHEATLRGIFTDFGYESKSINEGLAVVYAELESTNYTGIGISCGGGLCNVCFAYLSVPVISFSLPKAGDFVDAGAASVSGERVNHVRILKEESFNLNGHFENKVQQALSVYYSEMIQSLVAGLKHAFHDGRKLPKVTRPFPLVLSGGSALPRGFRERFEKTLRAGDFPIDLAEIRLASEPLNTSAKGALVAALCDM